VRTTRRTRGLIVWLAITAALASTAMPRARSAQDEIGFLARERSRRDLVHYHKMIDAYAAGDEAASVGLMLEWSHEQLDRAVSLIDSGQDAYAPWPARRFGLAAMLHTDAALRLSHYLATNDSRHHVEIAARVWALGARLHRAAVQPVAQRWYLAVSRCLRDRNALYGAEQLLEIGRDRMPGDPVILNESGTLAEAFGTTFALADTAVLRVSARGMDLDLHATSKRRVASLASAAQWLGDAAALDPGNDLLHVHLGRVQALRFQDEEATRILGSVLATTRDDATAYLAGVFIAAVRERQNRLPDAAAAYRAALERFPRGHAARIGLSHVLQQDGKGDAAREALANLLGEAEGATREPLWWYTFEPAGVADSRLDALRQEVRR
jgi:hypothetical protein